LVCTDSIAKKIADSQRLNELGEAVARKLGDVLKHVPEGQLITSTYRKYSCGMLVGGCSSRVNRSGNLGLLFELSSAADVNIE
jgi:hypothetical protein